ncbi:MAG: hypothetical protein STSR0004_21810 [Peptococcaceae bacterium]
MKTTVLIAEDDPVMRHILRKALEEMPDIEVIGEAGNGLEAIRLAKEMAPQVVFLDIAMPEKDGLEAAREICYASPETVQPWGRKTCKVILNNTKESTTMTKARARELEKKLGVNLTK